MTKCFLQSILLVLLVQQCKSQPTLLVHGKRDVQQIALTFDACSPTRNPGYDPAIVRILRQYACPATLFLGGRWVERYRSIAKELSTDPLFTLGTHGNSHKLLATLPRDSVILEIRKANDSFARVTGKRPKLFRPPFAIIDSVAATIADSLGLQIVLYDVASGDPDSSFTKEKLIHWVCSAVKKGSIIVFHINGRGWHTAEALPEIIITLRQRGYEFVSVDRFLAQPKARR